MGAEKRHSCWSARAAPRNRHVRPACRPRPPPCLDPRGNPLPGIQDTTAWNTEMLARTLTARAPSLPVHPAAHLCRTTRSANCRLCRPLHPFRRRSPESPSFGPGTQACLRPPSLRCTQPRGDAPQSQRKTTNAHIIIGFSFNPKYHRKYLETEDARSFQAGLGVC